MFAARDIKKGEEILFDYICDIKGESNRNEALKVWGIIEQNERKKS